MCTSPRPASFDSSGKLVLSKRKFNKEYVPFQVPCGKCIECRLEYARTWAVRASHEASVHSNSIFLTLTFNDESIGANKLNYKEFQDFIERLRYHYDKRSEKFSYMVCGEYGEKTGRKHYHAILFGLQPPDREPLRKDLNGHIIYKSPEIERIWGNGLTEFGSVTFESCSYVARYCLKKRGDPETDPLFKTSRHTAIGKTWLQENYLDIFTAGICVTRDGYLVKIPRYYEKWCAKHHPEIYRRYVTEIKQKQKNNIERKAKNEELKFRKELENRKYNAFSYKNPNQRRAYLQKIKQKEIKRKLD